MDIAAAKEVLTDADNRAKYDAGEETLATDKVDTEEVVEELCESVADSSAPAAEQEAGVANQSVIVRWRMLKFNQ